MGVRRIARLTAPLVVYIVGIGLLPGIDDVPLVTLLSIAGWTVICVAWMVLDD